MAKMKKCYYCDFDERGDNTFKHKDLLNIKIGEIQGQRISIESTMVEDFDRKRADIEVVLNQELHELAGVELKIHYCPMCGRRLAEDWEKEET